MNHSGSVMLPHHPLKKFMKKVDSEKNKKKNFSKFVQDAEAAKKRTYEVDKKTPYNVHKNTRYY